MYSELLRNSEETIFLQAVDEYFQLPKKHQNGSDLPSGGSPSNEKGEQKELELSLDSLNQHFCKSVYYYLEDDDNESGCNSEESTSCEMSPKKNVITCEDIFNYQYDAISKEKSRMKKLFLNLHNTFLQAASQ